MMPLQTAQAQAPATLIAGWILCSLLITACILALLVSRELRRSRQGHLREGSPPAQLASTGDVLKQGFTTKRVPEQLDVVVIGGGISGLTTAALLAQEGQRVLVLEQHDVVGGSTHAFSEKGYEFDVGLHYVGEALTTLLNTVSTGQIQWASTGEVVDEIVVSSERLHIYQPKLKMVAALAQRFPRETVALRRYLWHLRWGNVCLGLILGIKAAPAWIHSALLPFLLRLIPLNTTLRVLEKMCNNTQLVQILSYIWGTYGVPPSKSPWMFHAALQTHYFNGSFYPVGGSMQLAARLVPTIEAAGGRVLVRAPVASIVIKAGKAVGVSVRGHTIRARRVISAAGALNTFGRLLPEEHRYKVAKPLRSLKCRPSSSPCSGGRELAPSIAFLYLFVGIDSEEEIALPRHNLWVLPDWDHEAAAELPVRLDDASEHPLLLFISSPSAKDPAWAARHPKGKQVVLALVPTRWDYWAPFDGTRLHHRGGEYDAFKQAMTKRILDALVEQLPHIQGKVDYVDLGTPLSNNFYLGTACGEAYGLEHTPDRFRQPWLRPTTPVANLYLTGQDVAVDGVAGGVISGFLTAGAIRGRVFIRHAPALLAAGIQVMLS